MGAGETYGIISLIPVAVVIITAIITKRALEPLILGAIVGYIILEQQNFVIAYFDSLYGELGESAYFIIIFGLFGIFARLLEDSNAISGFTRLGLKAANNKKKTGIMTLLMGMVLFLDNYFSVLGTGISNRKISDENKMSREFFAFNVNVAACATCVVVPLSLWGVFMASQIEDLKILDEAGLTSVLKSVPFMFFAWISIIFALFYVLRIIKPFGAMKKAEERAEAGRVLPEDADISAVEEGENKKDRSVWNFAIPMIFLIGVTLYTQELTWGLIVGIATCFIMYIPQKMVSFKGAFDSVSRGFEDMFVVTGIVISAFVLQNANDTLGLAPYVVDSIYGIINANLLPAIAFLVLLGLGFVTGSFWGMAAVCFPILMPLAVKLGVDPYLVMGAIITGAGAGSATCFYGDSVTLTCGLTKIKNADYARTSLPMLVPPIIVTTIAFVIAGYLM